MFPRVRRSSVARLSISVSNSSGKRTDTLTDPFGSSLSGFFAMLTV